MRSAPPGTSLASFPGIMITPKAPQKTEPSKAPEAEVATHPTAHRHPLHEAGGAAGGALAGAAVGSIGGPAGAAAGAIIGGVVGAFVAKISDEEADRVSFHDGELDAAIGVNGGDLGAPNLKHPPAIRGTYSAGSAGGGGASSGTTSEGPMPAPKD
jgi:hypothetical protein